MDSMNDPVADFYDRLAPHYPLIFADWRKSIDYQAEVLDRVIRSYITSPNSSVPQLLDCACGIGTQAIGLALRGYKVHGTDISTQAVERAKAEAVGLNAPVTFGIADFRYLDIQVPGFFDIVVCCDNALPHLLSVNDLSSAIKSMKAKLKPGGLLLASIRDYDKLVQEKPSVEMPRVFEGAEGRRIVFQVWDWEPDELVYTFSLFILTQTGGEWKTIHNQSRYRALLRGELNTALGEVGFEGIEWHMPGQTGYYQPIVTARA
jgi:glycine/sarcosine N-methyltransferase